MAGSKGRGPLSVEELAPELTDTQRNQLRKYLELLLLWNRKISLVSQTDKPAILTKHFADSLFAARASEAVSRLVDLGAGAGFPGLVIAIARPEIEVTLIDSNRKKISFLTEVISAASIRNARAIEGRIEELGAAALHSHQYDLVIARALASAHELFKAAQPYLAENGQILLMKGPGYQAELDSMPNPPAATIPYQLADGSKRFLLIFRAR